MGGCAIILAFNPELDSLDLQYVEPGHDCMYTTLWIVIRNPGLKRWDLPKWLAEAVLLKLEEFEAEARLGMEHAFRKAWATLDGLPSILGVEKVKYLGLAPGAIAAKYVIRYAGYGGSYPAYIVYGSKPFVVLRRRSRRGTDKYARR